MGKSGVYDRMPYTAVSLCLSAITVLRSGPHDAACHVGQYSVQSEEWPCEHPGCTAKPGTLMQSLAPVLGRDLGATVSVLSKL